MSVKERIKEYAKYKKISIREFERLSNLNYGYVNAIRVSIQPDKVSCIASHFVDMNIEWLLTGKGEMLKNDYLTLDMQKAGLRERILLFINSLNIEKARFEKEVGLSNDAVSKMGDNTRKSTLDKISNTYPQLNLVWLLTGEGEMLKNDERPKNSVLSEPSVRYEKNKKESLYETINHLSATTNRESANISELIEATKRMADTADRNSRTLEKLVDMLAKKGFDTDDISAEEKRALSSERDIDESTAFNAGDANVG